MCESLLSVGLDVGTTTTQMIVSKLAVENRASAFSVPKMEIVDREILYRGQVRFTPLLGEDLVDAPKLGQMIRREYELAGITREDVDTGAVIITGETSRKENAKAVLEQISDLAGEFVVATAGPDLESVLAAKGAGAVQFSKDSGKRVLHMDIGGGTTNLALIEDGKILRTGCLNVGGRLVKLGEDGKITYVSPVLKGISSLKVGDKPEKQELEELAKNLARVLEGAAGWGEEPLLGKLVTREARPWQPPEGVQGISFSGGVADCIAREIPWLSFGDLGPLLGQAIRESRLCAGEYRLGTETIRATVGTGIRRTPPNSEKQAGNGRNGHDRHARSGKCQLWAAGRTGKPAGEGAGRASGVSLSGSGYGKGVGANSGAAFGAGCADFVHRPTEAGAGKLSGCGDTGGACLPGGDQDFDLIAVRRKL